jgi:hypothetical protein
MRLPDRLFSRLMVPLVALGLGVCASGCMTADMWERATNTKLTPSKLDGFVTSPNDRRVPTAVVVTYSPTGARPSPFDPVLAVPWDQASSRAHPPAPTAEDFARSRDAELSPDFQRDDPRHPGRRWSTSMIESRSGNSYCVMSAVPDRTNAERPNQQLTLILPAKAQRPAADLAGAQASAVLLTAPTIAADVVLDPLGIAWFVVASSSGTMAR